MKTLIVIALIVLSIVVYFVPTHSALVKHVSVADFHQVKKDDATVVKVDSVKASMSPSMVITIGVMEYSGYKTNEIKLSLVKHKHLIRKDTYTIEPSDYK